MLEIVRMRAEWGVCLSGLECVCVSDQLLVELVEVHVRNHVIFHDQTVMV